MEPQCFGGPTFVACVDLSKNASKNKRKRRMSAAEFPFSRDAGVARSFLPSVPVRPPFRSLGELLAGAE